MKCLAALTAGLLLAITIATEAAEIGYVEDFVLARDRQEALKLLIPGSEAYYYYHSIHLQNTEQFDQVEELLKAWIKRYKYTPRVREIQNRQALLTYEKNPQESLEFIRRQLNIEFNHQRENLGQKPNLPTAFDQALISRQRLTQIAKQRHKDLSGFEDAALDWLVGSDLNPDRRRHLLGRLQRPDYSNLAELVVNDLKHRYSKPFGSMPIHRQLLLSQLEECVRLKGDLLNQTNFVNAYLRKLHPNDDVDWTYETKQYDAYLDRLWKFVSRLDPVHNSLKTHVLYHRLLFDRARGSYDKDRFMLYIRLPRRVGYVEPKFLQLEQNRRFVADLNANFEGQTLLPPVRNDEPLVRSYLHHFFVDEASTKSYEPYISDTYLRYNFAETKIVNGLGEPEQWYSLLPPDRYQALKDRIDLDFAHANQKFFAAGEPVSLDLFVKNIDSLIVRVFEINTYNYYREHKREVNTDINLDGLVANDDETVEYNEPPLRRVRRHFEFPALTRAGVYVVDFIGNGTNSRLVVRKGQLRHLVRTTPVGQVFTIFDEGNNFVKDATIQLAGHTYQPNDDGQILVPFSTQPARQPIIISRGDFSSLAFFQHQAENYRLAAGIYVDRESLLKRAQAPVIIRTGLYLNGTPIGLVGLEDVRLTISSVDHEGVSSSKEVKDFELFEDRESVYEFQSPPRLAQISFTLRAKVQSLSTNKKIDLQVTESFQLNGIDKSEKVEDLHFAKIDGSYVLELRGRTGEAKPDRPVQLTVKHRDFRGPVKVTLQTDHNGQVRLGKLAEILSVAATGPEGTAHSWTLAHDQHSRHQAVHGIAGKSIELPYMGDSKEPQRSELSLIEVRGGIFVADRFTALGIRNGMLRIGGLSPGDYDLLFKETGRRIRLRIADGEQKAGYVLGATRHLEVRGTVPLQVTKVDIEAEQVLIHLANAGKFTRVHLFATRYQPSYSAYGKLASVADAEPYILHPKHLTSFYVDGRSIGDEYQYIIDRRYTRKFPGVMLDRPSVLLNPWPVRTTATGQQKANAGNAFAPKSEAATKESARGNASKRKRGSTGDFANLDFLGEGSVVLANLIPDEDGVVAIPKKALEAHQHLQIVAINPAHTAYRTVSLPAKPMRLVDLRLALGLDPKQHFTQQKQISVVADGDVFVLPDITTSRFETYDKLSRVYALYATLSGNAQLAEFGFILNWPNLEEEEKQRLYSKHACHELNFFLSKKDATFFEDTVQPFIANKKDKTFLDHWLLNNDVRKYLRPWNYERLNVVEQILLSQRIAADRRNTIRDVNDQFALLTPNIERTSFLFLSGVKGRALEAGDEFGFATKKDKAGEMFRRLGRVERSVSGPGLGVNGKMVLNMQPPPAPSLDAGTDLFAEIEGLEKASRFASPQANRRSLAELQSDSKKRPAEYAYFESVNGHSRQAGRALYVKLDKTQEWAENNYYKSPIEQQRASLVAVKSFWRDYVEHDPNGPFLSANFAEATGNFTEMMFALSLLDLPFDSEKHETEYTDSKLTLTPGSPMIVFHEEIRETGPIAENTSILVSQNFFRHGDRFRQVGNERRDKFVTDEFLVHTVYGCQIVVTNPTSSPQKLDVLLQIPLGALPVMNGQETRSVHLNLKPYNTQTIEYHFYFPAAGTYPHYPVHVSKNEKLLAYAESVTMTVVEKLSRIDRESWVYISQNGSSGDVLKYLRDNNLHQTNLSKIAFRMGNKPFFLKVVELLEQRHAYDHTLWSYGIKHNVVPAVREYLQHADGFVQQCGAYVDSTLLTIDPVARQTYQHLDYRPLVNSRAHQLGRRRQILNDRFHQQYHRLLTVLSYRRQLTPDDLMTVTYYLLLQDRIEEGMAFFDQVNAADLETTMQYDYFAAYLNLYRQDTDAARQIVGRYADHPVEQWRTAFVSLDRQLDEIESGNAEVIDPKNRVQRQTNLAATEPSFDLLVEAKKVHIDYQNLDRVLVNYYLMDIELLFSRNPFVQQHSNQFSQIRPNLTDTFAMPKDGKQFEFPLPDEMHNRNVLVEVVAGGQTKSQAYFSNSLNVQVLDNYGQLRVTSSNPAKPLSTTYVKVYARMKDGSLRFYKDGYTDLRGRFDYSSLNTNELDFVEKFSLLVLSEEYGAVVREATPPKR
jgi:hypothetical protein